MAGMKIELTPEQKDKIAKEIVSQMLRQLGGAEVGRLEFGKTYTLGAMGVQIEVTIKEV